MVNFGRYLGFLLFLAVLFPGQTHAQAGKLTVKVADPTGLPVNRAEVSLIATDGSVRTTTTNRDGLTDFSGLVPGQYQVEVTAAYFAPYTEQAVDISTGHSRLSIALELSPIYTTVEVSPDPQVPVALASANAQVLAEEMSSDLVESLQSVPGVAILRRGPTNLDPVVQGLRETQVAMIVDGTRTFAAGPARMDSELSHLDPQEVQAVEVVKGPYALSEGSGALSAILVKTPEIPRYDDWAFHVRTIAGYSTNGAQRDGLLKLFAGNEQFGFSVRVSGRGGNDYDPGKHSATEPSIPGDYSNHQFGGNIRWNPTRTQELVLASSYDEQTDIDYPGRLLNAAHFITRSWGGNYQVTDAAPWLRSFNARLYLNKKSHRMSNDEKPTAFDMPGRTPPFGLEVSLPTESDTLGGAFSFGFQPWAGWRLRTGFDFYNLDQEAVRFVSSRSDGRLLFQDTVWPNASINDQGIYVQAIRTSERGELVSTLRFDFVQADAGTPSAFFLNNTSGDLDQDEVNTSFSVAGRVRLVAGLSLNAGFGRAVRTASVLERYSDRFPSTKFQVAAEFLGDPQIDPEASHQVDLGFTYTLQSLTVGVGAFYRRIEDYITVVPDPSLPKRLPLSPPTVFRYVSGDHANFRGYDFTVSYQFIPELEMLVQGAHTLADDIEEDVPEVGVNEPVIGIPPFALRSTLRYTEKQGRFWGQFGTRVVSDQDRVASSRLEQPSPGFTTFDLLVGARFLRDTTFHFGVENLSDKRYFVHLNSLNPFTRERILERGRSFQFSINRTW